MHSCWDNAQDRRCIEIALSPHENKSHPCLGSDSAVVVSPWSQVGYDDAENSRFTPGSNVRMCLIRVRGELLVGAEVLRILGGGAVGRIMASRTSWCRAACLGLEQSPPSPLSLTLSPSRRLSSPTNHPYNTVTVEEADGHPAWLASSRTGPLECQSARRLHGPSALTVRQPGPARPRVARCIRTSRVSPFFCQLTGRRRDWACRADLWDRVGSVGRAARHRSSHAGWIACQRVLRGQRRSPARSRLTGIDS